MPKHPTALPDDVARKLSDLAREHGYGIERLTLSWLTKDLGQPPIARVSYEPEVYEVQSMDGTQRQPRDGLTSASGRALSAGDIVTWGDDEDGWIVRRVHSNGTVVISPRDSSSATEEWAVSTQDLWV